VNGANEHPCDTDLLDTSSRRVMLDGDATGSQLQAGDFTLDESNDLERIRRNYFEGGADAVGTKYARLQSG
jgi:methionine synthase I (cobalamin-dependent)